MINNIVADIHSMTGDENSKEYTLSHSDISMFIAPTTTEIKAMYGEMPTAAMYSYRIEGQDITLKPEDKIIVTTDNKSGLSVGDEFICTGNTQKTYIAGRYIIVGECNKV